ncbi:MAG: lasso peptide biosynthesis B2 protein [Steroidobacteraceae bacterium]
MLVGCGILSERPECAKPARATAYPLPHYALPVDSSLRSRASCCTHAPSFFMCSARASRQLLDQRFQSIVEFVRAFKRDRAPAFDFERAHLLTSVFNSLRLFFPRPYQCLFDSLALINFLARFKLYPDWVFGVIAEPFDAHCWVQADGVVLNDTIERVSAFTPIMCV